ncbi:Gfo/Idh/MocA family oxidoreductase [Nitrosopumilus sp.]|nr:Gfo/Idh/MocA family oxidoreductase [Nitrosopumilus sp.]
MKKSNKIAVVGIGKWGKNLIRDFSKISNITKCSSTGDPNNIKWLKKNYPKIEYVAKLENIFSDPNIDAVIISTSIESHYTIAKKALESKKHVFVEKPISVNVTQANKLIKIAEKNNLLLFVGHVFLYNEIFQKIVNISKKEQIKFMNLKWNKFGTFDEDIFLNILSHDLSILLKLFQMPNKFNLINSFGFVSKCDFVNLFLEFKNTQCSIQLDRFSNENKKSVTIFTKKNAYIWDNTKLFKRCNKDKSFKLIFQSKMTPLENESKEFIKQLNNSKISNNSSQLAKDVIQLISQLK